MRSFYVVLSGVHASGKTTILEKLSKIDNYPVFNETSDVSEESPLNLSPFERQQWILDNMQRRESEILHQGGVFIADRWVGDSLRYTDAFFESGLLSISQRDGILRRYWQNKWVLPDFEIVLTSDFKTLEQRINSRLRSAEQKKQELEMAIKVKGKFDNYARSHSFNRKIMLFDTTGKTADGCYEEIRKAIKNASEP